MEGTASRAPAGVSVKPGPGTRLAPSVALGVRWDGGDAETGAGVELGGGVEVTAPERRLRMELTGRTLLAHEGDLDEWGVGGVVQVEPGRGGRGVSFGAGLTLGDVERAAMRLWEDGVAGRGPEAEAASPVRFEAEGGYGLAAPGVRGGVLTPYAGIGLAGGGGRHYRIGARLASGAASELSLEGSRSESAAGEPDTALTLRWRARW